MARRMVEERFRKEQWEHRYDDHVAPINQIVDGLRRNSSRGWAPYVAPMYGGVNGRLLSVLRDPGPKTQDEAGSGFVCMENDDRTAESLCRLFAGEKIGVGDIVPWNAYPWYINRKPKKDELEAGVEPLKRLVDLMPNLRVVMLHGGSAQEGWKYLTLRYPQLVSERGLLVIETYHTSPQAFIHRDPIVREARREHLRRAFAEASRVLSCPLLSGGYIPQRKTCPVTLREIE